MINALVLNRQLFSGTTRLILDEVERRGWKASTINEGSSHLYIDRGDQKLVHCFSSTPPQQSYASGVMSNNKLLSTKVLEHARIYQLPCMRVDVDAAEEVTTFLERHGRAVIKPIDGSHGNGIRTNIVSVKQSLSAIQYAQQFSKISGALIQKQFDVKRTFDIRILCINGKYIAAIHRVPARVFGDGNKTVSQLIKDENNSERRGVAYKASYAVIDEARAERYLGVKKMTRVPKNSEQVRVMDVANYGAGGELIDITDAIPGWMRREAEVAAKACELVVAGVDYLVSSLPEINDEREDIEAVIIEINKSPALMIHDKPHIGKNRQTVHKFVDLIETYDCI